jgi:hypothetical protein
MPIFEMTRHSFIALDQPSFSSLNIRERDDIQRLLRNQISVISDDLYVLAEEFSDWEESRRRIDLLAIDKDANLVVIEIKRSNDGGHMELQAIRYASMISMMTFERAVQIHGIYLKATNQNYDDAKDKILEFLDWEEPRNDTFASDVRIILLSADFSKELTTSVLWLRDRDIDIRCVRIRPYKKEDIILVDVEQIIPLPEAQDYQIRVREKEMLERKDKAERYYERQKFWKGLIAIAKSKETRHANLKPTDHGFLSASSGKSGLSFNYVITQENSIVELYIDRGIQEENKKIFDQLNQHHESIEELFRESLHWERLNNKKACRIKSGPIEGGYRSPENHWPEIQNKMVMKMILLELSLKEQINKLQI